MHVRVLKSSSGILKFLQMLNRLCHQTRRTERLRSNIVSSHTFFCLTSFGFFSASIIHFGGSLWRPGPPLPLALPLSFTWNARHPHALKVVKWVPPKGELAHMSCMEPSRRCAVSLLLCPYPSQYTQMINDLSVNVHGGT